MRSVSFLWVLIALRKLRENYYLRAHEYWSPSGEKTEDLHYFYSIALLGRMYGVLLKTDTAMDKKFE